MRPTTIACNRKSRVGLLPDPERSVTSIARLLGVSVGTLYNHIPDLQELRAAGAEAAALTAGTAR